MVKRSTALRELVHWTIGVVVLATVVRTWLLLGLVAPVTVSGSSMAPTLRGTHVTATCPRCETRFDIGADQLPTDGLASCPSCGRREARTNESSGHHADRLLVDRTAYWFRQPRRGELVVFMCPENAKQFCVKRVLGLPGESVSFSEGNLLVDGTLVRKNLPQQRAVRQLVHREREGHLRWHPEADAREWKWQDGAWRFSGESRQSTAWLRYVHIPAGPITDDATYNQRVTRKLNVVPDTMVTALARLHRGSELLIAMENASHQLLLSMGGASGAIELQVGDRLVAQASSSSAEYGPGEPCELTVSLFDKQVLVAIGEDEVLRYPLSHRLAGNGVTPSQQHSWQLAIGGRGAELQLAELSVWRDIFYEVRDEDRAAFRRRGGLSSHASLWWRLGQRDYFLVGDNQAISDDSRSWPGGPGLDGKYLVGKVLGAR